MTTAFVDDDDGVVDDDWTEARAPRPAVDDDLESQLAEMRGYRATYNSVVEKARAQGGVDEDIVERAHAAFDGLEKALGEARSSAARRNIIARSEEVEQMRAYIQPASELLVEATTLVADMTDWGVPTPILAAIDRDLVAMIRTPPPSETEVAELHRKRAALNKLYQYYDAWSEHVTAYERWATRTAWALGVLLFVAAVGCIYAIDHREPLYGFIIAGFTGALLSVLGKFPPMLGWGQWASYTPRMLGRITTGVATTLAGAALLVLDVVQFGEKKFELLFDRPTLKEMLLLVGLGIVLGFTERLLSRLQELVFKQDRTRAKA